MGSASRELDWGIGNAAEMGFSHLGSAGGKDGIVPSIPRNSEIPKEELACG